MIVSNKCLARLTSWGKYTCTIGESYKHASIVKICRNIPEKGKNLCQECEERPIEGKYQSRICHGLLTDPPCDASHIYGSEWYWQQVAMYGDPEDKDWILKAQKAQTEAEEFCVPLKAWKVQRPSAIELKEIQMKKKEQNKAVAAASAKTRLEKKGTLLEKFAPIRVMYEESSKVPEKMPTDTCRLWKDVIGGVDVWVSEAGHVFDCDTTGQASELLGRMVKNAEGVEEFVEITSV
jgi:uncharacterized protein YlaI